MKSKRWPLVTTGINIYPKKDKKIITSDMKKDPPPPKKKKKKKKEDKNKTKIKISILV